MSVIGHKGKKFADESMKLRVGKLLNSALEKDHSHPLVVFIDVNLSPVVAEKVFKMPPPNAISMMMERIKLTRNGKDRFNLLMFTNLPQHYGREDEPAPAKNVMTIFSPNPFLIPDHQESLLALDDAAMQHGNIPNKFPED